MTVLWAASLRHLLRHPAQLALALVGLSLGVATIIAVDIATASSQRAFELSMEAVNGTATHQIVGGPEGIDERLYVDLHTRPVTSGSSSGEPLELTPIVEGYVTIGSSAMADREMQLVGVDPLADVGASRSPGDLGRWDEHRSRVGALRKWFTERGSVVMAAGTARQLGLKTGSRFSVGVGGVDYPAVLIGQIAEESAAYDGLMLTDIAQAQEWLGRVGRLSRIDVRMPKGPEGEAALASLRQRLPPGVGLHDARGRTRESLDMTGAFTTNLKAMSLLALLVSTLLIYGAVSFAVVQRRRVIGVLRALGATR